MVKNKINKHQAFIFLMSWFIFGILLVSCMFIYGHIVNIWPKLTNATSVVSGIFLVSSTILVMIYFFKFGISKGWLWVGGFILLFIILSNIPWEVTVNNKILKIGEGTMKINTPIWDPPNKIIKLGDLSFDVIKSKLDIWELVKLIFDKLCLYVGLFIWF